MDEIKFSINKEEDDPHVMTRDDPIDPDGALFLDVFAASEQYSCVPVPDCGSNIALFNTADRTAVSCHQSRSECEDAKSRISSGGLAGNSGGSSSSSKSSESLEGKCFQDSENLFAWTGECPPYEAPTECPSFIDQFGNLVQLVFMAYRDSSLGRDNPDINSAGCMRLKCVQPGGLEGTNAKWGNSIVDKTGGESCCGVSYEQDEDGNLEISCPGVP
jgi:hypothetical protein